MVVLLLQVSILNGEYFFFLFPRIPSVSILFAPLGWRISPPDCREDHKLREATEKITLIIFHNVSSLYLLHEVLANIDASVLSRANFSHYWKASCDMNFHYERSWLCLLTSSGDSFRAIKSLRFFIELWHFSKTQKGKWNKIIACRDLTSR